MTQRTMDISGPLEELFEGGPPLRLMALARLPAPICPNDAIRALMVLGLGWIPLLILVIANASTPTWHSFTHDVGVHSRFAVAAPLLVLAFPLCGRRLGMIAVHFLSSGLLDERGRSQFLEELAKVRRLINSHWAEFAAVPIAYGVVIGVLVAAPEKLWFAWQFLPDGKTYSPAGWWVLLVSLPLLLLLLLLGWLWRLLVWVYFLRRITAIEMRLIAAHPDQASGLGFLGQSVRAFSIVGMALGTIAAGRFARVHLDGVATNFTDALLIGGSAMISVVLFAGPLVLFTPMLMKNWRLGAMRYGALATALGVQFEREWFADLPERDKEMLSQPDFSATTDLYQVVSNVYAMRFIPIDLRSIIILIAGTLLPFIPAILLSMPMAMVLEELKGLLF